MYTIKVATLLSGLLLILTFISVNSWSAIPIGNLWTTTIIQFFTIYIICKVKKILLPQEDVHYKYINWYLIWCLICTIRGFFIAENLIEYKQLILGSIVLVTPIISWIAYKPFYVEKILYSWYKYGLIAFVLFFFWIVGYTQFYLSPLLLLFCFFPLFPRKKRYLIIILGLLYCILAGDTRSQLLKGIVALCIGTLIFFKGNKISYKLIKLGHITAYLCTFIIFLFIMKGLLNTYLGTTTAKDLEEEFIENDSDTRSLIYIDVIDSSLNNNYVLIGRTPARGNDITVSGILFKWAYSEDYVFNKDERHYNEVMHLNTYTWCGLIGLLLSSLAFFRASYLAVYKSHNIYISLLGCYVAFQWSFGWIENMQRFDILNISIWIMIGMCNSTHFRNMTNPEFKTWIRRLL